MALSRAILNKLVKCLWFEVVQWQVRLQMSHIFKISDTLFYLNPFGGLLVGHDVSLALLQITLC